MSLWGFGSDSHQIKPVKKKGTKKRVERLVDTPKTNGSEETLQQVALRRGLIMVGAIAVAGLGYWACRRLFSARPKPPNEPAVEQDADVPIYEYFDAQRGVYAYSTDPNFRTLGPKLSHLVEVVQNDDDTSDDEDDDDEEDDGNSATSSPPPSSAVVRGGMVPAASRQPNGPSSWLNGGVAMPQRAFAAPALSSNATTSDVLVDVPALPEQPPPPSATPHVPPNVEGCSVPADPISTADQLGDCSGGIPNTTIDARTGLPLSCGPVIANDNLMEGNIDAASDENPEHSPTARQHPPESHMADHATKVAVPQDTLSDEG